jgi:hypothetical protein
MLSIWRLACTRRTVARIWLMRLRTCKRPLTPRPPETVFVPNATRAAWCASCADDRVSMVRSLVSISDLKRTCALGCQPARQTFDALRMTGIPPDGASPLSLVYRSVFAGAPRDRLVACPYRAASVVGSSLIARINCRPTPKRPSSVISVAFVASSLPARAVVRVYPRVLRLTHGGRAFRAGGRVRRGPFAPTSDPIASASPPSAGA